MLWLVMNIAQLTIPTLQRLPETLLRESSVRLELEQGVVIFRATAAMQNRIAELLERQQATALSEVEERELTDYEELDDYLSHVNRLIRNFSPAPAAQAPISSLEEKAMIQNDVELRCTLERITKFATWVAGFRVSERTENFKAMSSGYLAEIERMNAEVLEFLRHHASEAVLAQAA